MKNPARRVPAAEIESLVVRSIRGHLDQFGEIEDAILVRTYIARVDEPPFMTRDPRGSRRVAREFEELSSQCKVRIKNIAAGLRCVYRKPKPARNGDEVHQGSRVN
jgi:hypothetical protein